MTVIPSKIQQKLRYILLAIGVYKGVRLDVYILHNTHRTPLEKQLLSSCLLTTQRVEYASERLAVRTAETEAMEAEELQNTLSQPNEGGGASGGSGDAAGGAGSGGGGEGDGKVADDVSETAGKGES